MGGSQERPDFKLIVGLGNPGQRYANTRHNVGFSCLERLAHSSSIEFTQRRQKAFVAEGKIEGVPVALAKPRTFVNNSGDAITYLHARYKTTAQDLLVICDDMALPLGKLRLRARGSAGGHNGLKSVIDALRTQEFARVRIGIGRPPPGVDDVEYVLGTMPAEQQREADEATERAAQAVVCVLTQGIDAAMDRFN